MSLTIKAKSGSYINKTTKNPVFVYSLSGTKAEFDAYIENLPKTIDDEGKSVPKVSLDAEGNPLFFSGRPLQEGDELVKSYDGMRYNVNQDLEALYNARESAKIAAVGKIAAVAEVTGSKISDIAAQMRTSLLA